MSVVVSRTGLMSADQDLAAMRSVPVPEVWPPIDGAQPIGAATQPHVGSTKHASQAEAGPPWPRQFALLLAETLAGVRPVQQVLPLMSQRSSIHLHRLLPAFKSDHRPRVLRVLTTRPAPGVVEMTMIVVIGPRTRAIATRLELTQHPQRWLCTDIEAA